MKFLQRRQLEGMGSRQLLRYIDAFRYFLKIKHTFAPPIEQDLEAFLLSLGKLRPYTRQKYWYCMKKFYEWLGCGEAFTRFKIHFNAEKLRPHDELLTPAEMDRLIGAAPTLRDCCLMSVMCEGGYRIGEILTACVNNVQLLERSCKIMVQGKTGWRNPLLVKSAETLRKFLQERPTDGSLFGMTYAAAQHLMDRCARRAGIRKHVNQQILRSSAATRDSSFLTEPQLCMKYGWRVGSKMPRIYVRMSGRDLDEAILRMNGITDQPKGI